MKNKSTAIIAPVSHVEDWINNLLLIDSDECIFWPFTYNGNGYGKIYRFGLQTNAHRYICILAHGEPEKKLNALHSCGNGSSGCVNPRHLRWGTQKENSIDTFNDGKNYAFPKGEKHPFCKLSDNDVIEIYHSLSKISELAKKYNVSKTTIYDIKNGVARNNITKSLFISTPKVY